MKYLIVIFIVLFVTSCNNERSTPKGTVKLFVKYASEKNMSKIYDMLTPSSKRQYTKGKEKLIRSDFQVNKYNLKVIRFKNRDKKNKNIYYMEIVLKDGSSGFITLKRIDGKFYIKLD